MKFKKFSLTAIVMNRVLIGLLILLCGAGIYGCYLLQGFLQTRSIETNHAKIDADVGRNELQRLQILETYLKENENQVSRAESVIAESKEYKYQDQIVKDINSFAATARVNILGYNFPESSAKKTSSAPGSATVLKTIQANITLENPVDYKAFLRFINLIEQNLTKMQITGVTVSPDPADTSKVNSPTIGLEVYVQ